MKHLIIFLAIIMFVPLGSKHNEAIEKNEAERIECYTQTNKLLSRQLYKEVESKINVFSSLSDILFSGKKLSSPVSLIKKIYIIQLSLLI